MHFCPQSHRRWACIAESCGSPIPAPHPTRAGVNNTGFPAVKNPVSLKIIAKLQFFPTADLPWAPAVPYLACRVEASVRVSFTMLPPAQLRIAGCSRAPKDTESGGPVPSERLPGFDCQLRGALDSSWISGSVATRLLAGSTTARGDTSPIFHAQEAAHTHLHTLTHTHTPPQ